MSPIKILTIYFTELNIINPMFVEKIKRILIKKNSERQLA